MPSLFFVDPKALHWANPTFENLIDEKQKQTLLLKEQESWFSDLFWGERLAVRMSKLRYEKAPKHRKKVWLKILQDEMKHQNMVLDWLRQNKFVAQSELPKPAFWIKTLSEKMTQLESNDDQSIYSFGQSIQLILEQMIHSLIDDRLIFIQNEELKKIFNEILKDEVYHIHASIHELSDLSFRESYQLNLSCFRQSLFPLHLAHGVLSRDQFQQCRKQALKINESLFNETFYQLGGKQYA